MKPHSLICPEVDALLESGKAVGRTGKKFDSLTALSTASNLITLHRLIQEIKPRRTLEVGLAFGGSCLVFLDGQRSLGHAPEHQHIALDPFQSQDWDDVGLMLAEQAHMEGYLDFRPEFSHLVLPKLIEENIKIDIAYIDGSHIFEDVFLDFYFVCRLLAPNGIVLFDDSTDAHVRKVLDFVSTNMSHCMRPFSLAPFRPDGDSLRYKAAKSLKKVQLTAFQKIEGTEALREYGTPLANF